MYRLIASLLFLIITASCQQSTCPPALIKPHEEGLLRVSIDKDPQTVDPRKARDFNTLTLLRMLYEGLVRARPDGTYEPALAKSIDVSKDGLIYTIKLKDAYWSNGQKVQADDFIYAWKMMISPGFAAPNAYQLYPIKNAKAIKDGKEFIDALGVFSQGKSTLVIELEEPNPEFIQMLSTPFYLPVNYDWAKNLDDEGQPVDPIKVPYNGPYILKYWHQQEEIQAVANPKYWDASNIHVKKVQLVVSDNNTAIQLFNQDELDWVGSPLSSIPVDAFSGLKTKGCIENTPADGVVFLRVNTQKPPFNNARIRRALSQAIDRKSIVESLTLADEIPTTHLVPKMYGLHTPDPHALYAPEKALAEFNAGLKELGMTRENLPPLQLAYIYNDRTHKIVQALQRQWKIVLGIEVGLPTTDDKVVLDNIRRGDYTIARGSWYADIHDPANYLDVFKYKDNGTNNTGWENPRYISYMNEAAKAKDEDSRKKALSKAEDVLLSDLPIIPLYQATFSYMKKPRVKDVYLSPLGYLDFRYASVLEYEHDFPPKEDNK